MGAHTSKQTVTTRSSNRDARSVLDSIRRIVRALRVSSRQAERYLGLSGAQLFVLQQLAGAERLSVNDLAERTLTHQSSVSVVVQRLMERGLVVGQHSKRDGRRLELSLTTRGQRALARAPGAPQERLIFGLRKMPAISRTLLAGLLEQLIDASGLSGEDPGLFFEDEATMRRLAKLLAKKKRQGK